MQKSKKFIIEDKQGNNMYPATFADVVYTEDGGNVAEKLKQIEGATPNAHTHTKSQITDLPSNLVTQTMLDNIGLGVNCKRLESGINFDAITQQGNFMVNLPTNKPSTHIWLGDWWYVKVRRHNDDYIEQEVTNLNPNNASPYRSIVATWKRLKNAKQWYDWLPCNNPTITIYKGYNADFNLLTLHGTVLIPTDEVANECLNKPIGKAGVLEVMPIVSTPNGSSVLQRFTPYNNCTKPLVRRYYDTTSNWTPWKPQDANNADSLGGKTAREYQVYLGDNVSLETLKNPSYNQNYDCWVSLERATGIGLPDNGNWHLSFKKHKNTDGYGTQIAMPYGRNEMYMRSSNGTSWNTWSKVGGGGVIKSIQRGVFVSQGETSVIYEKGIPISTINPSKSSVSIQGGTGGDKFRSYFIKSVSNNNFVIGSSDDMNLIGISISWEVVEYV